MEVFVVVFVIILSSAEMCSPSSVEVYGLRFVVTLQLSQGDLLLPFNFVLWLIRNGLKLRIRANTWSGDD